MKHFVIQFSDIDEFLREVDEFCIPVVRVWPAMLGLGGGVNAPVTRVKAVSVQALSVVEATILSLMLVVGTYHELYQKPFGPRAEAQAGVLHRRMEEAVKLVRSYVADNSVAATRSGQIHTSLAPHELQRAYWDGFESIYKEFADVGGD